MNSSPNEIHMKKYNCEIHVKTTLDVKFMWTFHENLLKDSI